MNTRLSPRDRCAPITAILPALFVLIFLHFMVDTAQAQSLTSYHIGNSLTWDSRPDWGLTQLATDAGLSLTTGYHIRCSGSLDHIVSNPDDVCVIPGVFGSYTPALTNNAWDAITLQPFSSTATPSTARLEYEAMKDLIQLARLNPSNSNTVFHLYTGWPTAAQAGTDFGAFWETPGTIDPDADFLRNKPGFDWIYNALAADPDLAGVDIRVIPVGDVLTEIDDRMTSGVIPGFDGAEDLYRDALHLNNLGWFVASNTVLSTLFQIDPTGTPTNSAFVLAPGQVVPIEITTELGALIQDAIWDVVSTHPNTGILLGDLDGDGFVGINDLNIVLANWNQNVPPADPLADPSGDGFVGIDDLNEVLGNWNAGTPPSNILVPEPAIVWLLVLPLIVAGRKLRPLHTGPVTGIALLTLVTNTYAAPTRVLIVGDSTVKTYPQDDPREGWGQKLPNHYNAQDVVFSNWAIGGRSSKTFITEGLWDRGINPEIHPVGPYDYVLIQFGHNDLTGQNLAGETWPDSVPDTLPPTGLGSLDVDWYRNNIRTYINDSREAGAIPVIVTPMERRLFDVNDQVRPLNLLWAQAAIAVAQEEHVQLIDLNTFSVDLINGLGIAGSSFLHPFLESEEQDNVHTSPAGADTYAQFIASQISFISGDLDADGFVGINDLNVVLNNWNQNVTPWDTHAGDANGDGYVGIDDLNTILPNWNAGTPPGVLNAADAGLNTPEPASLVILTGLLGLLNRRV